MRAHFERSKENDEGTYKKIITSCETWLEEAERHGLNPGLLLDVLMLFQIYERCLWRGGKQSQKNIISLSQDILKMKELLRDLASSQILEAF